MHVKSRLCGEPFTFILFTVLQDTIKQVFDNLIQLDHANIVKFHQYWKDTQADKPRVSMNSQGVFSLLLVSLEVRSQTNSTDPLILRSTIAYM